MWFFLVLLHHCGKVSKYANRLFLELPLLCSASSLVIYRSTSRIHLRLLLAAACRPWSEISQLPVAHLSRVNEKWQILFSILTSKETLISLRKKCSIEMNDSSVSNGPNVALMTISWRAKYFLVVWLITVFFGWAWSNQILVLNFFSLINYTKLLKKSFPFRMVTFQTLEHVGNYVLNHFE